jgi:uncharacterized repeat protein (TIGR02543 family)/LPXTG-motif cell wall-anchored protein
MLIGSINSGASMRAITSLTVAGLTVLLVLGTVAAPAHAATVNTTTVDGISYTADDANVPAGATVTGYDRASGPDVAIPSTVTIDTTVYDVTTIGGNAFFRKALTSVILPATLTTIGGRAFAENPITELILPNSVTTIGVDAFVYNALTTLSLSNTLTTLSDGAFAENALTSVTLPDSLTAIGNFAFAGNSLTEVTLPNMLTTIGRSAFASSSLTEVTLPDSLTTIGSGAFYNNDLTSVTLPDSLTTIGDTAFGANSLTSVILPNSVTTIEPFAFAANPLAAVRFLGAAPTSFGESVFTSDPLVSYFWSFGAPQTAGGFTSPTWNGYRTQAIAIIRYDTDGAPAIDPAEAIVGTTLAVPTNATRDGYTFDGWYTAETGGTAWNFTTDTVVGDMTLFARYAAVPATPSGTAALVLAATGVASPVVPAGIGALVLLAGITLLLVRRRRHTV